VFGWCRHWSIMCVVRMAIQPQPAKARFHNGQLNLHQPTIWMHMLKAAKLTSNRNRSRRHKMHSKQSHPRGHIHGAYTQQKLDSRFTALHMVLWQHNNSTLFSFSKIWMDTILCKAQYTKSCTSSRNRWPWITSRLQLANVTDMTMDNITASTLPSWLVL